MSYKLCIKASKKSLVPEDVAYHNLQLYTATQDVGDGASIISNRSDSDLPLPKFLRLIEYEDALS
ncbi:hypothetical protein DFQ28_003228, partial [Apophysomyces sp. BC1034]